MNTNRLYCQPNRRAIGLLAALAALFGLGQLPEQNRSVAGAESSPNHLTSRPRAALPAAKPANLGEKVRSRAGQSRRPVLPGGSLLYVNENPSVKLDAARQVTLSAGEVFVEAGPVAK